MYKKNILLSTLFCTLTHQACDVSRWLEIKPSYFFFSNYPMKNIYNRGGFEIQGSFSAPFCNYLDLYASIGYRKACGHALNTNENTRLTVIPLDIGLKPIFNFCERFYYFAAFGLRYFSFHQHNDSPYVDCFIKNNGLGFFINTGFNVLLANCLLLGIFGEYSYEKKKVSPSKTNVYSNGTTQIGGFAFGGSLGLSF